MKKNILLIGFGNIGKRHFEGIIKSNFKMNIYIIDPLISDIDKNIIKKNNSNIYTIEFYSYLVKFKFKFDLAIVATTSDIRSKILKKLLLKNKIDNLILEKILFQKLNHYNEIYNIFKTKNIKVWINCPRKFYEIYKFIKKDIKQSDKITIDVTGENWGLGCNSIHFIDLLDFFKQFKTYNIFNNNLHNKIYLSKRKKFFEFKGSFSLITNNGDIVNLKDDKSKIGNRIITITCKKKYIIDETKKTVMIINSSKKTLKKFNQSIYQSDITNIQINEIFSKNNSSLSTYKDSMKHHIPLINFFLNHFNLNSKYKRTLCPIT
tara:strand:+ start:579 stop:1538 length:960 start_codon:yes stop_codon:yes gene_type:complete